MIVGMNLFTIVAEDERQTLDFYVGLFGLTVGYRRALGFPGAWLNAGGAQAVLHLYFERPMPATRTGVIDHLAFSATGLSVVKAPRPRGPLRRRGHRLRLAPPSRRAHLAAVEHRSEWRQCRARLRSVRGAVGPVVARRRVGAVAAFGPVLPVVPSASATCATRQVVVETPLIGALWRGSSLRPRGPWHGEGRRAAAETIHAPWMLSIRCLTCRPCCKR